jgi:hypothetical protein
MLVFGKIPDVVNVNFSETLIYRSFNNGFGERSLKHFRKYGKNVYAHCIYFLQKYNNPGMLMDVGKYESRGLTMLKMHFSKTRLYQVKPNHWKVRV